MMLIGLFGIVLCLSSSYKPMLKKTIAVKINLHKGKLLFTFAFGI